MSVIASVDQAKAVQGRIMSDMKRIARETGVSDKQANRLAADSIAAELGFRTAQELRREIGKWFLKPSAEQRRMPTTNGFKARYVALMDAHDVLPPDDVLNDIWGCAKGTLSSIRSEMRRRGYEFDTGQEKMIVVVKRPAPAPASVPLVPPPSIVADQREQHVVEQLEGLLDAHDNANHEEIKALLSEVITLLHRLVNIWS